jgi:hypothetical protein
MNDILKAFAGLNVEPDVFEKAKKGEKKVGNPKYKRVMKDGRPTYVLANPKQHPTSAKSITPETFDKMREGGKAEEKHNEPPVIRDIASLKKCDFLNEERIGVIERCLKRAKFYERSIGFAKSVGNKETIKGHSKSRDKQFEIIDNTVNRAFAGKNFEGFSQETVDKLNAMDGIRIQGASENSIDFINTAYEGFSLPRLVDGIQDAIKKQKAKLERMGISGDAYSPKTTVSLRSDSFDVSIQNSGRVTDNAGYSCDLNTNIIRQFKTPPPKAVYHSYLVLGKASTLNDNEQNVMSGGIAKDMMRHFQKEYEECGMDQATVTAADAGFGGAPYAGSNTWGRWGFRVTSSMADTLISGADSRFQSKKDMLVDEYVIEHDDENDVATWKKNQNGAVSKTEWKTGTETDSYGRKIKTKVVTNPTENGKFRSKVLVTKQIMPSDVEKMKSIKEKYMADNPGGMFRMKEWYEQMDSGVVRGLLMRGGWSGKLDLNGEAGQDFAKNLYKKYEKVTQADKDAYNAGQMTKSEVEADEGKHNSVEQAKHIEETFSEPDLLDLNNKPVTRIMTMDS